MPKQLTIASIIDKNKLASDVAWVIALEIEVIDPDTGQYVETIRVARNDENIQIDGNFYQALPFSIDIKEIQGEVPPITVGIQDQKRIAQSYMQNYGGGIGFKVKVMIVPIYDSDSNSSLEPDLVENYKIVSAAADSSSFTATWTLGAENPLAILIPRRKQNRDRCSWEFESTECGYSGGLSDCTRTLEGTNGCRAHNNAARYGGWPGIVPRG